MPLACAGVLLSFFSCKSQYEILLNSNDVDAKYEAAFEYYNNGKYSKAAALFESLSVLVHHAPRLPASQHMDRRIRSPYPQSGNAS